MQKPDIDEVEEAVRRDNPDATHFVILYAPHLAGTICVVAEGDDDALAKLNVRGSGPYEAYRLLPVAGLERIFLS